MFVRFDAAITWFSYDASTFAATLRGAEGVPWPPGEPEGAIRSRLTPIGRSCRRVLFGSARLPDVEHRREPAVSRHCLDLSDRVHAGDDVLHAVDTFSRPRRPLSVFAVGRQALGENSQTAGDDHERVVDLVCRSAGKQVDRAQLGGLAARPLRHLGVGDVREESGESPDTHDADY